MGSAPFAGEMALRRGFKLPARAFLAPLEGVMTPQFVKVATALELVDVWMTPFVPVSEAAPSKASLRRRLAPFLSTAKPVVVQLLGHDARTLSETAARLVEIGIRFVGLNLACPSGYVLSSGSGGAVLHTPQLAGDLVKAVSDALQGRAALIVKLRSGWTSPAESETLLPLVRDAGADACIYHFRTVGEKYDEVPDGLSRIKHAVELAGEMPLIGNGDLKTPADARTMFETCSCAGIALGRGFMADPFLLRRLMELPSPALEEGRSLFLKALAEVGGKGVHGNILELARTMYGESSAVFRKMLSTKKTAGE